MTPESMIVAGGPMEARSATTTAHARPAPRRSAKYIRPMRSGRRLNSVAIMTPMAMNDANSANAITNRRARLENDVRVP